jgi:serine/threonine protein kinase
MPEENRDAYLQLIEKIGVLDNRFSNLKRVNAIGGGGYFSLVFESVDQISNKKVAIKFYNPHHQGNAYRLESFKREAKLLEEVTGSKDIIDLVAPLSEFVHRQELKGGIPFEIHFPYYVLELASSDVETAIAQGGWSAERILLAFRGMCRASQRIHRLLVAHRDLKPSNFLVMADSSIKLADLGAARKIDGHTDPLSASYAFPPGDNRYVAPEMFALLHDSDPAVAFGADIYSLGAILFEMFSGSQLVTFLFDRSYTEELMEVMRAVSSDKRRETYHNFVESIAVGHPLPSLAAFGSNVPRCIRRQLDELYMSMSNLDYRKRLCNYRTIFRKIDVCVWILRHEEQYRRWRDQKYRRQNNARNAGPGV